MKKYNNLFDKICTIANFNKALDILDKLTLEDFTRSLNELVQKEIDLDFLSNKNSVNFSINNIQFLTSKTITNKYEYILNI